MKNFKNLFLIAVVTILVFSQFISPPRSVSASAMQDPLMVKNDSLFALLHQKISDLEEEVQILNRKLYGVTGSVSLFPTSISDLEDKIDDLEDDVQDVKGSYSYGTTSLSSLESEVDDLKRSSHSHD